MEYLFWISVIGIGYVYLGYPLIIAALARLVGLSPKKAPFAAGRLAVHLNRRRRP